MMGMEASMRIVVTLAIAGCLCGCHGSYDLEKSKLCAEIVAQRQEGHGWQSNYSAKYGRCFLRVNQYGRITIIDPLSNRMFARYEQGPDHKIAECNAWWPTGGGQSCGSGEDFESLTEVFMGPGQSLR